MKTITTIIKAFSKDTETCITVHDFKNKLFTMILEVIDVPNSQIQNLQ